MSPSHPNASFAGAAATRLADFHLSEESGVLALNRRLRHAGQVHVIRSACLWTSPRMTPSASSKREAMMSRYWASPELYRRKTE